MLNFFFFAPTHVGMDVVPVGDSIDIHVLFLNAESSGVVPPVVHGIQFLGGFVFPLMLPLPKKTLTLILILTLSYISRHSLSHIFF